MNTLLRLFGEYGPDKQNNAMRIDYAPQENGTVTLQVWWERKDKPGEKMHHNVVVLSKPMAQFLKAYLNNITGV